MKRSEGEGKRECANWRSVEIIVQCLYCVHAPPLFFLGAANENASQYWPISLLTIALLTIFSQYLRNIGIPCCNISAAPKPKSCIKFTRGRPMQIFKLFPIIIAIGKQKLYGISKLVFNCNCCQRIVTNKNFSSSPFTFPCSNCVGVMRHLDSDNKSSWKCAKYSDWFEDGCSSECQLVQDSLSFSMGNAHLLCGFQCRDACRLVVFRFCIKTKFWVASC